MFTHRHSEMKTTENQGRVRNCSADSGCDVDLPEDDLSCTMLEENLNIWTSMLESLFKQKLEKVKADLRLSFRGNEIGLKYRNLTKNFQTKPPKFYT